MPSAFAAPERGTPTTLVHTRPVPADPDDLLPELQVTLMALTGLEIRHEIELDCLEEWSWRGSVKRSLYAEREWAYQQARDAHLERWQGCASGSWAITDLSDPMLMSRNERLHTGCGASV